MSSDLVHRLQHQGAHYPELRKLLDEAAEEITALTKDVHTYMDITLEQSIENERLHDHIQQLETELKEYRVASHALARLYGPIEAHPVDGG